MMEKGKIIISKSGRDKGKWFTVIKTEGNFVYIANGKLRKIENPKKKNIKHIAETKMTINIEETLTNKNLNKMILELKNK